MLSAIRLVLLFVTVSNFAFAHGDTKWRVEIEAENSAAVTQSVIEYKFQLVDTKSNTLVTERDLLVTHEKKLHVIVYDPSLNEFQHVHPESKEDSWGVTLTFPRSGQYWIWAQGELNDREEFSTPERITVNLSTPALPAPPKLEDTRTGTDHNSVATLSSTRLKAGKMAMLDLSFSRADGSRPENSPYLGAFAHIIAVSADGDSLIHVHPMDSDDPAKGMLHVTFPYKGMYRLWVQFMDAGEIKIIPLSVQVN